ncbi:hypothetical protein M5689_006614 [Euphorbia peplus]|nr:hypothetical protein M5689_006614 [Euphorbia peplus]
MGAETFKDVEDPEEAELWLIKVEDILNTMRCPPEHRVRYVVSLLAGDALVWWKGRIRGKEGEVVLWDEFRNEFNNKYCSQEHRDDKLMEFMNLKQNEMTEPQYDKRFSALSRYAPVMTEEERCRRFLRNLIPKIRTTVLNCVRNYQTLHETATAAEKAFNEEKEMLTAKRTRSEIQGENRRPIKRSGSQPFSSSRGSFSQNGGNFRGGGRFGGSRSVNSSRGTGAQSSFSSPSVGSNRGADSYSIPACETCGRHHRGECWELQKVTCYGCGELGHYRNKCPYITGAGRDTPSGTARRGNAVGNTVGVGRGRRRGRGSNASSGLNVAACTHAQINPRVFKMTREEAVTTAHVISGTIIIFDTPAFILLDSGSTLSYMTSEFAFKSVWEGRVSRL